MKRKKPKVSTIYSPDGRVIDVIELKGRNGKKTLKMQPRRNSLKEGEKVITGHTKEGKEIDHFNGYQKIQGKIIQYNVSVRLIQYRSLPITQAHIPLRSGERVLGICGQSLPPTIFVDRSGTVYPSSGFGSGVTLYVGSVDVYATNF